MFGLNERITSWRGDQATGKVNRQSKAGNCAAEHAVVSKRIAGVVQEQGLVQVQLQLQLQLHDRDASRRVFTCFQERITSSLEMSILAARKLFR